MNENNEELIESKPTIVEFKTTIVELNLDLYKYKRQVYDIFKIGIYVKEFYRGFIVKKEFKPKRTGTQFTFKICEDRKELEEYKIKIGNMMQEYDNKWRNKNDK